MPKSKDSSEPRYSYEKCQDILKEWDVTITGAYSGDILQSTKSCTKNTIIKVYAEGQAFIHPQRREVAALAQHPSLWNMYLQRLSAVPFFANMSESERGTWLMAQADEKETSIGDQPGIQLEFLQLGGDFIQRLSTEQQQSLLNGEPRTANEVESLFESKTANSKARRNTLVLLKSRWKIGSLFNLVSKTKALTFDVTTGQYSMGKTVTDPSYIIWEMTFQPWAFYTPQAEEKLNFATLFKNQFGLPTQVFQLLDTHLKLLTPGHLKSLLQKLIRFQPLQVRLFQPRPEETSALLVDTPFVLLMTIKALFEHVGTFVPDIGRFVGGVEGLCKRLAVIALEDAHVTPEQYPLLLSLLSSAVLSQTARAWRPSAAMFEQWCRFALSLWQTTRCFDYDSQTERPAVNMLSVANQPLSMCSALLDHLRSFKGDLNMVRDIARTKGRMAPLRQPHQQPAIMPIWHMLDQHCSPALAWYFPFNASDWNDYPSYTLLFRELFRQVTGVNPRRESVTDFEARLFVQQTRVAQAQLYYDLFMTTEWQLERTLLPLPPFQAQWQLEDSVLSALCGSLEITEARKTYLATLDSFAPENVVVMKRPSRDTNDEAIDPRIKTQVVKKAKERLRAGIKVTRVPRSLQAFQGAMLKFDDMLDNYTLNGVSWNISRTLQQEVRWVEEVLPRSRRSSSSDTMGLDRVLPLAFDASSPLMLAEDAFDNLESLLLPHTPLVVLRRLMMYTSGFESTLSLHPIGQDGTGVEYMVAPVDSLVFGFLRRLCLLFPAGLMPQPGKPGTFVSAVPFLLWDLQARIRAFVHSKRHTQDWLPDETKFPRLFEHEYKYVLQPHQEAAVQEMIQAYEKGRRAYYVWLPAGAGKTLVTETFQGFLYRASDLPRHILYTYPKEAGDNLRKELKMMHIPFHDVNLKTGKLEPFSVSLIEHDSLRKCLPLLLPQIDDAMFIADEAHKMLAPTQRTSAALQLASLSRFCIALSGTPVMNTAIYRLIPWLRRIVSFEVTPQNLFTAASAMVHQAFDHGIKVVRSQHRLELPDSVKARYLSLIPPVLGGQKVRPTSQDFQEALRLCYTVCYKAMVKEAIRRILLPRPNKHRVFIVARDQAGINEIHQLLLQTGKIDPADIYAMQAGNMITLTPIALQQKKIHDFKIVIGDIRHSLGFSLTTCDTLLRSVYPSNLSTVIQIEGRLLRLGNAHPKVDIQVFYAGFLERMLTDHQYAQSVMNALSSLFQ